MSQKSSSASNQDSKSSQEGTATTQNPAVSTDSTIPKSVEKKKTLEYSAIITQAWSIVKPKLWLFIGIFLVVWVASYLSNLSVNANTPQEFVLPIVAINITGIILSLYLAPGALKICLLAIDGKSFSFKDLFSGGQYFFKFLLGTILYVLIILGGLILLIVPGIIWSFKYGLWPYLVVDENLSVTEAIKRSGEITKGYKFKIFVMGLLMGLIAIAGLLALIVGYFVALPVIYISLAIMYRVIAGKTTGLQSVVSTGPAKKVESI